MHTEELLLDIWRVVGKHIEIRESAAAIAGILSRRLPIDHLVIMALDTRKSVATVRAISLPREPAAELPRRIADGEALEELISWMKERERIEYLFDSASLAATPRVIKKLLDNRPGTWLYGSLQRGLEPVGAVFVRASETWAFDQPGIELFQTVLEPLAAALENDGRLQELNSLREAAEADKRSALDHLGRTQLTDVIIGADSGLRKVMEQVRLVTATDVPVLLLGETGSGKEVIARAVHDHSPRASGPFIRVNCGAIAPELIDSELFGHVRGAFTGATATRRGWFERADRGTLLLDEIGDLPLPAQVRLLRVVQEGAFERVGGEKTVTVDVRIVAATHRDLETMTKEGRFREDLWYRISSFPIAIPALRDRKSDIPELAAHFARRAARRFGLRARQPTAQDIAICMEYDWPGNIRELASVVDRAAILGNGEKLEIAKALGWPGGRVGAGQQDPVEPDGDESADPCTNAEGTSICSLDEAMRRHIESALARCRGKIEGKLGAAACLEINPHTLRARMRKLGIEWTDYRTASPE